MIKNILISEQNNSENTTTHFNPSLSKILQKCYRNDDGTKDNNSLYIPCSTFKIVLVKGQLSAVYIIANFDILHLSFK